MKLSVVIPCYDEEKTLQGCVERVMGITDASLALEIIIVDDCSTDGSLRVAKQIGENYPEIVILHHEENRGKGAALRTGFQMATGDFVAVQDADMEYDPADLKRLLLPLIEGRADVVLGSRFLSTGAHRVLYFWHALGNRFLTFLSNMFTDLNITDMECGYKVFKREVIQGIDLREDRFGFEPEVVAKIAHRRLRIYEMGISYYGRTYEEGKKIGGRDGLRALFCILRYNAPVAPLPVQFLLYLGIGGLAAIVNLALFLVILHTVESVNVAAPAAFIFAAILNYLLCIVVLFRHRARWNTSMEIFTYWLVVCMVCLLDLWATRAFLAIGASPWIAKILASMIGVILNFTGRRFFVFPEPASGPWRPQGGTHHEEKKEKE